MSKFDILKSDYTINPPSWQQDNTQSNITISLVPAPNQVLSIFKTPLDNSKFQPRDNFILKNICVTLPYCFSVSQYTGYVGLSWYQGVGTDVAIPEIGDTGTMYIPLVDRIININQYVNYKPADNTNEAEIILSSFVLNINPLNAPDILNTEFLFPDITISIMHNLNILS